MAAAKIRFGLDDPRVRKTRTDDRGNPFIVSVDVTITLDGIDYRGSKTVDLRPGQALRQLLSATSPSRLTALLAAPQDYAERCAFEAARRLAQGLPLDPGMIASSAPVAG